MKNKEVLSILYLITVLALHTLDLGDAAQWNDNSFGPFRKDLIVHFSMFIPWAFFASTTWEPRGIRLGTLAPYRSLLLLGILTAMVMETTQAGLPYRTFSGLDMMMNVISVGVGYGLRRMGVGRCWGE